MQIETVQVFQSEVKKQRSDKKSNMDIQNLEYGNI